MACDIDGSVTDANHDGVRADLAGGSGSGSGGGDMGIDGGNGARTSSRIAEDDPTNAWQTTARLGAEVRVRVCWFYC